MTVVKIAKIDGLGTFFPKRRTKELKSSILEEHNNLKSRFGVDKEEWIRKAAISRKLVERRQKKHGSEKEL